jgi:hypothetical protein
MFGFNSHVDVYLSLSNLGSTYQDIGSVAVLIAYPYTVWTQSSGFVTADPGGALQVDPGTLNPKYMRMAPAPACTRRWPDLPGAPSTRVRNPASKLRVAALAPTRCRSLPPGSRLHP